MLVDECVALVLRPLRLLEKDVVVDGTSSTLDSGVSAEVEVVLEGLSNASLNKCTGKRVGVLVNTPLREEANVMTLGSDDDQESLIRMSSYSSCTVLGYPKPSVHFWA